MNNEHQQQQIPDHEDPQKLYEALLRMKGELPSTGAIQQATEAGNSRSSTNNVEQNLAALLMNGPSSSAHLAGFSPSGLSPALTNTLLSSQPVQPAVGPFPSFPPQGPQQFLYGQLLASLSHPPTYFTTGQMPSQPVLATTSTTNAGARPLKQQQHQREVANVTTSKLHEETKSKKTPTKKQAELRPKKSKRNVKAERPGDSSSGEDVIRKDKVEEALHSKPQRGKKRRDLSASERQELTRTRNREHAKSTRLRKKAREQELMEYVEECKGRDAINSSRCQSLKKFLSIRGAMLEGWIVAPGRRISSSQSVSGEGEDKQPESETSSKSSYGTKTSPRSRSVSFTNTSQSSLLEQVVANHDLTTFRFLLDGLDVGIEGMDKFDSELVSCLLESSRVGEPEASGASVLPSLMYQIDGGDDGIAFTKVDTAYARIGLCDNSKETKTLVVGFLTARFGTQSGKLEAAEWNTVFDFRMSSQGDGSSSASSPLARQSIYPSFVSLDHAKADVCTSESAETGPGMDL